MIGRSHGLQNLTTPRLLLGLLRIPMNKEKVARVQLKGSLDA
jgi:hypothetical protein